MRESLPVDRATRKGISRKRRSGQDLTQIRLSLLVNIVSKVRKSLYEMGKSIRYRFVVLNDEIRSDARITSCDSRHISESTGGQLQESAIALRSKARFVHEGCCYQMGNVAH